VRDRVRFFQHDVSAGIPSSAAVPYDLVVCRNVLIYLQPPAQAQALHTLIRSVADNGAVCLGEAEWPLPVAAGDLEPLHPRHRIFMARLSRTGVHS
jgi:chemotaxis protein methyltransferase CheR